MTAPDRCPSCGHPTPPEELARAFELAAWRGADGACPGCVQQTLLAELLTGGEELFRGAVQRAWPLDPVAAFGVLPTPLRLHADPRFAGDGVTVAMIDSDFSPHPDLVAPVNRIAAWVDATVEPCRVLTFGPSDRPDWPGAGEARATQWHGTMTSVVLAGNGASSGGLYRGLAWRARLILVRAADDRGRIGDPAIERGLRWIAAHRARFGIRVASLSVGGDGEPAGAGLGPLDAAVEALVEAGVTVVAAAGNAGERRLVPPATAPSAVTVGGLDDRNVLDRAARTLWHGSFGRSAGGHPKPEVVAPSLWVAAPLLPGSPAAADAEALFARRRTDPAAEAEIAARKLVSPGYQHADGTSFAAPIVASVAGCLLEANPRLTPRLVREILIRSAEPVPGASPERQGAGAVNAGTAVRLALEERHRWRGPAVVTPIPTGSGPVFRIHDHRASEVAVFGSWDGWTRPLGAAPVEPGLWETAPTPLPPGQYQYKFLLDRAEWLPDPTNPRRASDGTGGINSRFEWPGGD